MTREEAGLARAIDAYSDLDNRIRAAAAWSTGGSVGAAVLAIFAMTAIGAGDHWRRALIVWLPLAAVFLLARLIARVCVRSLEERRRERDEERRLAELRAAARRMRIAGAFASIVVGEAAVEDAVERRAA